MNHYEKIAALSTYLARIGIKDWNDQNSLRLIEKTLHRWSEMECNGEIERQGDGGPDDVPFRMYGTQTGRDGYRIADRERGALKRLTEIMKRYPKLWYYHQGDPRGCSLYVGRWADGLIYLKINGAESRIGKIRSILHGYV